jgi:creatinine amidohydrolase
VLFVSGHATNGPPIDSAILQLRYELPNCRFRQLALWQISDRALKLYSRDGADFHANRGETSLLLAMRPELVRLEAVFDEEDVTPGLVWSYPMPATTRSGVVGRPSEATARDGAEMLEILVEDLSSLLTRAAGEDWPKLAGGPG